MKNRLLTLVLTMSVTPMLWAASTNEGAPSLEKLYAESDEGVTFFAVTRRSCLQSFPELASIDSSGYEQWRSRRTAQLQRIESSDVYRAKLKEDLDGYTYNRKQGYPIEEDRLKCRDFLEHSFQGGEAKFPARGR